MLGIPLRVKNWEIWGHDQVDFPFRQVVDALSPMLNVLCPTNLIEYFLSFHISIFAVSVHNFIMPGMILVFSNTMWVLVPNLSPYGHVVWHHIVTYIMKIAPLTKLFVSHKFATPKSNWMFHLSTLESLQCRHNLILLNRVWRLILPRVL